MSESERRLPVYFLVDCSSYMRGDPIEAIQAGFETLLSELRADPQALETAHLSVIIFGDTARQLVPLTEVTEFQVPPLQAGGATSLGAALEVLKDSIEREVRRPTMDRKGDWKPLVFILSCGAPTDMQVFDRAVDNIKDMGAANIIACGAGSNMDTTLLKRITPNVLRLSSLSPADFAEFFKWVSGSIAMSSAPLDTISGPSNAVPVSGSPRRLPAYLLLDCSGSMQGEPIEAVRQGVRSLLSELRSDPQALETACLSVITFASTARQVTPLTELLQFQEPSLQAGGTTALGEALEVLKDSIAREVRKTTKSQKGDWKPLVFLLTDGTTTDRSVLDRAVDSINEMGTANIIACGAGSNVDTTLLKRITPHVILLNSTAPGDLAEFFKWVSGSIAMSSASLDAGPGAAIALPPVSSSVFYVVP